MKCVKERLWTHCTVWSHASSIFLSIDSKQSNGSKLLCYRTNQLKGQLIEVYFRLFFRVGVGKVQAIADLQFSDGRVFFTFFTKVNFQRSHTNKNPDSAIEDLKFFKTDKKASIESDF